MTGNRRRHQRPTPHRARDQKCVTLRHGRRVTGHPLPDPASLVPIEEEFWTEDGRVPAEATIAVRGAPITGEKFLAHATRQAREYSLRGGNMAAVSTDLVLSSWPLQRILADQLATYSRYATCPVERLVEGGFEVLATGAPPHADVVLPVLGIVEAERLARFFAPTEEANPHKDRRR